MVDMFQRKGTIYSVDCDGLTMARRAVAGLSVRIPHGLRDTALPQ